MKWDLRFLEIAELVATWSKDPSTKVGAVVARPNQTIASLGYNGFPRGVEDEPERYADRPTKYAMTVHAEVNAILAAREPLDGCTLYVHPFMPCADCAGAIIQAGVKRVVAPVSDNDRWSASFETTKTMFREAGVAMEFWAEAACYGVVWGRPCMLRYCADQTSCITCGMRWGTDAPPCPRS